MEPLNLLVSRKLVADDTRRQFEGDEAPHRRRRLAFRKQACAAVPATRPAVPDFKVTTRESLTTRPESGRARSSLWFPIQSRLRIDSLPGLHFRSRDE